MLEETFERMKIYTFTLLVIVGQVRPKIPLFLGSTIPEKRKS